MPASPHIYPSQRLRAIEKLIFNNKKSFIKRFLYPHWEIDKVGFGTNFITIVVLGDYLENTTVFITVKEFTEWRDNLWREES